MNLGIPIICNNNVGDVDQIMEESMPELLINEFSKIEYQRVINLILDNYQIDAAKIIKTSHEYYSLEKGVKKYSSVYKNILNVTHDDTSPLLK